MGHPVFVKNCGYLFTCSVWPELDETASLKDHDRFPKSCSIKKATLETSLIRNGQVFAGTSCEVTRLF